jgi:mono/diheme cytochrome c family protein
MLFCSINRRWAGHSALAFACILYVAASVTSRAVEVAPKLPPPAQKHIDFVKDIQPILAKNCYSCHGPTRQKGELRWDVKAIALKGGEHGLVIVPGHSADSRMIQLVSAVAPAEVMPAKGDPLTAEQIGLLRAWIDQGANWPNGLDPAGYVDRLNNWSFKFPVRPALPVVQDKKWVRNPIDAFVLAGLEKENLHPSPEADRLTLIRRLSLDLIGLPPTLEEIDRFVADKSPNAYNDLVERLLASPHYGEQWARHWLDVARYADSNGYEKDLPRSIWPYRDWVINAYNENMPFDEFTIEQLAGDLLPNATQDQKVATGFNRNSMINEEGGIDPEEFRIAAIINRVETTGKTWLGLTINCAQCHSHKYDPISQREFYQFFAFLNNDDEPTMEVPNHEQQAKRAEILAAVDKEENDLIAKDPEWKNRRAAWEQKLRSQTVAWEVLPPDSFYASLGTKFNRLADNSLLSTGSNPGISTYTVTTKTALTNITAFRLEALADPNLPHNGPGRSANGNFVLSQFSVMAVSPDGKTNSVILQNATADYSQPDFSVTNVISGKVDKKLGWGIAAPAELMNQDRKAVFETMEPIGYPGGTTFIFTLQNAYGDQDALGRFRISATTRAEKPIVADPLTTEVRKIFDLAAADRTPEQQRQLSSFYRSLDPKSAGANQRIADLLKEWPEAPSTMVLAARSQPRVTHIFNRGDFRNPGAVVSPGIPAFLPQPPKGAPLNRLTLAKSFVDGRNPLTARVVINRIWQAYFGKGIVITSEDFGTQGDKPSDQKLLDWLACEFMSNGWNVKAMQRLIVESATYRQSSTVSPALYAADQYNRLLARGPRFRVDAEGVWDIALRVSGLLSEKIGGPSVYPAIPDGVLSLGYGAPMKWETSQGDDRYRRGMYTFWKRSVPYPSLSIFDAPNADVTCPRRVMSDTPLQALTTLNDTVFVQAAQALGLRVWKDGGITERDRAVYAFRLCTGRPPDEAEANAILALVTDRENYFENRTTEAIKVASPDLKNPPEGVNLHKVAAWTLASRVLLNMDETITKE